MKIKIFCDSADYKTIKQLNKMLYGTVVLPLIQV